MEGCVTETQPLAPKNKKERAKEMENKTKQKPLSKYSLWTKIKFYLYSIIGVGSFFVNVTINGKKQIIISHFGDLIGNLLGPAMIWVCLLCAIIGVVLLFDKKKIKKNFTTPKGIIFSILRFIGLAIIIMYMVGGGPGFIGEWVLHAKIGGYVAKTVLPALIKNTIAAAILMPFLLNGGFVEFVSTFLRPIMRPVFRLPGRSSVYAITSFFGATSVGIVATDIAYMEGKFTGREAVLCTTAFCTTTMAYLVTLLGFAGLNDHFGFYMFLCFWTMAILTIITGRIWPLRKVTEETYNHLPYIDEDQAAKDAEANYNIFVRSLMNGYETAQNCPPIYKLIWSFFKTAAITITGVCTTTAAFSFIGLGLYYFTPVYSWLGYIYWPFAKLIGLKDIAAVMSGGISALIATTTPAVIAGEITDLASKLVLNVFAMITIVNFNLFVPTALGCKAPYKLGHLVAVFIERTILIILVAGIPAQIYAWLV